MRAFCNKTKIALAVVAIAASASASAVEMSLTNISGSTRVWAGDPVLTYTQYLDNAGLSAAQGVLSGGSAALPPGAGGNVELSKFGGPVTTLTGNFNGKPIWLSSLVDSDWGTAANPTALTLGYIGGAADSAGITLNAAGWLAALTGFFTDNPFLGGYAPWELVSDPNISYVNLDSDGHTVLIGLAGFIDASFILQGLLPPGSLDPTKTYQVSEVVKVNLDGLEQYLYGYSATLSGVCAGSSSTTACVQPPFPAPPMSYTGNYEVKIPEPGALALFGIGLVGLYLGRRRRA